MQQKVGPPGSDAAKASPLVFICLVFYPDTSASSILFSDLLVRLAEHRPVTVFCGFPAKEDRAEVQLPRHDRLGDVQIVRCGLRLDGKRTLVNRALAYGSFLLDAGRHLLGVGQEVSVLGATDPPFTPVVLWLLSRVAAWRYRLVLLDLYPDGLVALGLLSVNSIPVKIWRALNRRAFRAAQTVIVIGRDMARRLEREYGVPGERLRYIPHWGSAEVDCLMNLERGPLLTQLGLHDKFVVQYSGNMGLWHDIDALVDAAAVLRDTPCIHFLFIGKGRRRASAERRAHDLELDNITWLEFLPREHLAASLRSCDAALISMRPGLEGVAVPSKLYGILAAGRPVIAQVPADSEVAMAVREHACGVVVAPGDSANLARSIVRLATHREEARGMGERGNAAYRRYYTLAHAVEAFGHHL